MSSPAHCSKCGCVLAYDEKIMFEDKYYCEPCYNQKRPQCDVCGQRKRSVKYRGEDWFTCEACETDMMDGETWR